MSARPELVAARQDFIRFGDHASAGALLEAAFEAWNNEDLSERDYVEEVCGIQRWLVRLGAEDSAARAQRAEEFHAQVRVHSFGWGSMA
jgi:hypothetical protein